MADLHKVPVVEVTCDNLPLLWSTITSSIKSATFIAIDTELSGLGDRKRLNAKDIDERYASMSEVSRTRSILSFGLSCFKIINSNDGSQPETDPSNKRGRSLTFDVETFNIFVLCSENYVVEPRSLKFLVNHGFDFNKQYAKGLPYHRGNDKPGPKPGPLPSMRQLYTELLLSGKPLVLHNALVDLVYLYQSLYAELPSTMTTFLADLAEVYTGGVYDTKYLTEFKARLGASYLEYVFRKCQRENSSGAEKGWSHVQLTFERCNQSPDGSTVMLPCGLEDQPAASDAGKTLVCQNYANHGWCAAASNCPNSHDIDRILDSEQHTAARKRRKKRRHAGQNDVTDAGQNDVTDAGQNDVTDAGQNDVTDASQNDVIAADPSNDVAEAVKADCVGANATVDMDTTHTPASREGSGGSGGPTDAVAPSRGQRETRTGGHRAGFDAFMTGYIFAFYVARYGKADALSPNPSLSDFNMKEFANKVYLGGKDIPLMIAKSAFSKTSKDHKAKQEVLQRMVCTRT